MTLFARGWLQGSKGLQQCHHLGAAIAHRCQLWLLCRHRCGDLSLPIHKALVTSTCCLLFLPFRPGLLLQTVTYLRECSQVVCIS